MENISYLILDFGKVLAGPTTGEWFLTPCFLEQIQMDFVSLADLKKAILKYSKLLDQQITTLEEEYYMFYQFYASLLKEIKYPFYDDSVVQKIAFNFAYSSDKYTFYPGVKEELEKLSKRYTLLLLSDNWPSVIPILKQANLWNYFQKVYVSSIYGYKKEEGKFFDFPILDFQMKGPEAIFVDDNECLLDVAVKKGLKVRLMDRKKEIKTSKYSVIHDLDSI